MLIISLAGPAPCRCRPLSSNVRRHAKGLEGTVCSSTRSPRKAGASSSSAEANVSLATRGIAHGHQAIAKSGIAQPWRSSRLESSAGPEPRLYILYEPRCTGTTLSAVRRPAQRPAPHRVRRLSRFLATPARHFSVRCASQRVPQCQWLRRSIRSQRSAA